MQFYLDIYLQLLTFVGNNNYMSETKRPIYCPDCLKNGYKNIIGMIGVCEGVIYLRCRRCKKEYRTEIKENKVMIS